MKKQLVGWDGKSISDDQFAIIHRRIDEYRQLRLGIVLCLVTCLLLLSQSAFALPFRSALNRGNELYKKGEYSRAGQVYNKILEKKANDEKARFNLGDSLFKEGKYRKSQRVYESLTGGAVSKGVRQASYYNLGNSFFKQEDYKSAINAYTEALKLEPKDKDAQFNLDLAKKMMAMPKQEKEKRKEDQGQKKKEELSNKSQSKDQGKSKDIDKDKQQEQSGQMSKEDAMRILHALEDEERHKTQTQKAGPGKDDVKDW